MAHDHGAQRVSVVNHCELAIGGRGEFGIYGSDTKFPVKPAAWTVGKGLSEVSVYQLSNGGDTAGPLVEECEFAHWVKIVGSSWSYDNGARLCAFGLHSREKDEGLKGQHCGVVKSVNGGLWGEDKTFNLKNSMPLVKFFGLKRLTESRLAPGEGAQVDKFFITSTELALIGSQRW